MKHLTCKKSCTKADLSTEGRGPVCRVPIPTLSHYPLVISTTIPVAVWYRYFNHDILSIHFLILILVRYSNNNVEGPLEFVVCFSQLKIVIKHKTLESEYTP